MSATNLQTSKGRIVSVPQGASCNLVVTFADASGSAIAKTNLATLKATVYDAATLAVINSRDDQNVLDANGGTVATDGTLTLRLQPLDNTIVDGTLEAGHTESHVVRLTWTWSDGVATRTGVQEWQYGVEKLPVAEA